MAIRVFGLTGGIATGKSTVARRFAARGLPVIDADVLARQVVEPGSAGLEAVAKAFGPEVLTEAGTLDRKRLGDAVFSDPAKRERLNSILHPLIREGFARCLRKLEEKGEPLACYEVPLLFEVGLAEQLRPIVVVSAPEDVEVARLVARDGRDEATARKRLAAQMPLGDKIARADHVIDNAGSVAATERQADRVLDAICAHFAVPSERYPVPA